MEKSFDERVNKITDLLRRCLPYIEDALHTAECLHDDYESEYYLDYSVYEKIVESESLLNDISMILNGNKYLSAKIDEIKRTIAEK